MHLFSADLFRNFAIGFIAGALLIAGANAEHLGDELASPALAAEMPTVYAPSAEFMIAPEGTN